MTNRGDKINVDDVWERFTVFANGSNHISRDFCHESSCDQGHISVIPEETGGRYKAVARYYDDEYDLPEQIPEKVLLTGAYSEFTAVVAVLRQGHCLASVWVDMGPNEGRKYQLYMTPMLSTKSIPASPEIYDWADGIKALENTYAASGDKQDYHLVDVTPEDEIDD